MSQLKEKVKNWLLKYSPYRSGHLWIIQKENGVLHIRHIWDNPKDCTINFGAHTRKIEAVMRDNMSIRAIHLYYLENRNGRTYKKFLVRVVRTSRDSKNKLMVIWNENTSRYLH